MEGMASKAEICRYFGKKRQTIDRWVLYYGFPKPWWPHMQSVVFKTRLGETKRKSTNARSMYKWSEVLAWEQSRSNPPPPNGGKDDSLSAES